MTYNIIASGSSGNATVIDNQILIDCGVSFNKLAPYYKKLKLVLLTHIHGDHFNKSTIKRLAKERPTLRFACCSWLVNDLVNCGVDKRNIDVLEIGKLYDYRAFKVSPVLLYHDVENCGYRVIKEEKKLIYATDTNTLEGISAKDYDVYLIEGNHYEDEINAIIEYKQQNGLFAYEIEAKSNHLSIEKATEWLLKNMGDNSIYELMHQSKNKLENYKNRKEEI